MISVTLLTWTGESGSDKGIKMTGRGVKEERRCKTRFPPPSPNGETLPCILVFIYQYYLPDSCRRHLVSHGREGTPSPTDHSSPLRASLRCSFISNHAPSPFLSESPILPVCLPLAVLLMWSFSERLSHVATDRIVLNEEGIGAMLHSPSGSHHQPLLRAETLQTNSDSKPPLAVTRGSVPVCLCVGAWLRLCVQASQRGWRRERAKKKKV